MCANPLATNVACVCALREIIVMTGMRTRHSDQSTICQNAYAHGIKSENLHANSSLSSRRGHRFHAHLLACQSGSTKINMMRALWQSESYRTHNAHTRCWRLRAKNARVRSSDRLYLFYCSKLRAIAASFSESFQLKARAIRCFANPFARIRRAP